MEKKQASSMEEDQKNQILPNNQAGTTSENRHIPGDEAQELEANQAQRIPPGLRFEPGDGGLISEYLNPKIQGKPLPVGNIIQEAEVYKHDPEELTRIKQQYAKDRWYFFAQRERKGQKVFKRETRYGSWRSVQKEKGIVDDNGDIIGYKKPLEYFREGKKTDWLMTEYNSTLESQQPVDQQSDSKKDTVICRIYRSPRAHQTGIIPDLNHPRPKSGGDSGGRREVKRRRLADAPQAIIAQAAPPTHPTMPRQQQLPCEDICTQDHESHEQRETDQEKADDQ